jgi:hypothetical protein
MRDRMVAPVLCALLMFQAAPAITLFQDFDSGSLDVATSLINGDQVILAPRETWTSNNAYRWVYFQASDVNALNPEFRIDRTSFLGSLDQHRYVYSYDQSNWHFFDNGGFEGDDYVFQNNGPFTSNDVFVAYGIPYPLSRTDQLVTTAKASPYAFRTNSGDSQFVLGQTAGGMDDLGRTIDPQDLQAFRITDPLATGPKIKVLAAAGAHSAETPGNFALEGMVQFLLSDAPAAANLRSQIDFYVYPQVNPDGRFAGYYRSSVENPSLDYNRYYDNPAGFTDLTIVTEAMRADTGGDVDYLLDFHAWWGPWTSDNFVFTRSELVSSPLLQALGNYEPTMGVSSSDGQPGMLRIWGMSSGGLDAEFAYTPEIGFHPDSTTERWNEYGETFARALLDVLGQLAACDLNGDQLCDSLDADLLTAAGNLTIGIPSHGQPRLDLDSNGIIDFSDLLAWLASAATENGFSEPYRQGDANLDGVVDGSDFIRWNENRFSSDGLWSLGDFDGDGFVDGTDFIRWNEHRFTSIGPLVVAEPAAGTLLLWYLLGVVGVCPQKWHRTS